MIRSIFVAASAAAILAGTASAQDAAATKSYVQVHGGAFFATADGF